MTDPASAAATQLQNIVTSTGRSIPDWATVIRDAGLTKHGQMVSYLKSEHGLTHGNANALAHAVRDHDAGGAPASDALLAAQYSGGKAALRPIYDEIVASASALGDDVEVAVKKTSVSLRRKKQFALVSAPSATRISLGFNLRGADPSARVTATSGMCTHSVNITDPEDVDDEIVGWLRSAYEAAG